MNSILAVTLSLFTFFLFASCTSSSRTVAQENEIKRSPEGDPFSTLNQTDSRKLARTKY